MKGEHINMKADFRIALINSMGLALCYIILFFIGKVTGLVKIIELRYLNYVFACIFCYKSLSQVYREDKYSDLYYANFLVTILTTGLAQLWFCILFFIYLNIDRSLSTYFISRVPWDIVMPRFSLTILLFAEGLGVSSIISLFLIQLFDWNKGLR